MGLRPGERTQVIGRALSVVSGKWQPEILLALHDDGPLRFNELEERLDGISGKVLSENLESLQDAGVVERHDVEGSPQRVDYRLTDAGSDLEPVFDELAAWGVRHVQRSRPCVVVADRDRRLSELYRHWLTPEYTVRNVRNADGLRRLGDLADVVVVDRRLPGIPIEDVPAFVRSSDDACRVVLLTGEQPSHDVADTPCDAIVPKPTSRDALRGTIETQLKRHGEPSEQRERRALAAHLNFLEKRYAQQALADSDHYERICSRLAELEDQKTVDAEG
ncbi:winged helix-turn-helix transcriptional regulator [Haloarchaeobius sp. DFWS5]|uniref:winged helix-turn-helix transcriptional regulator n=1 Tax=Haloarchaeobius sp. DFWS5 TaxID=3446114 RepID=UPI003EBCC857